MLISLEVFGACDFLKCLTQDFKFCEQSTQNLQHTSIVIVIITARDITGALSHFERFPF